MTPTTRVIAGGGSDDVLTVRHLRIDGSQREIGRALAQAADTHHGAASHPRPASDAIVERVRRRWFADNHPTHAARMSGIADHHGIDPDDVGVTFDWIGSYEVPAGCSVAFYPGEGTKDGHGLLSRKSRAGGGSPADRS